MRVTKHSFCNNKAHVVEVGPVKIHFSYDTAVGLEADDLSCHVINEWGSTTGKHMRETGAAFLGDEVSQLGLANRLGMAFLNWSKKDE